MSAHYIATDLNVSLRKQNADTKTALDFDSRSYSHVLIPSRMSHPDLHNQYPGQHRMSALCLCSYTLVITTSSLMKSSDSFSPLHRTLGHPNVDQNERQQIATVLQISKHATCHLLCKSTQEWLTKWELKRDMRTKTRDNRLQPSSRFPNRSTCKRLCKSTQERLTKWKLKRDMELQEELKRDNQLRYLELFPAGHTPKIAIHQQLSKSTRINLPNWLWLSQPLSNSIEVKLPDQPYVNSCPNQLKSILSHWLYLGQPLSNPSPLESKCLTSHKSTVVQIHWNQSGRL